VVRFLSPEWVDALDRAAQRDPALAAAAGEASLVVQHDIAGACYYVDVDGGRVRVRQGAAAEPTVTFSSDRATATAIARGELSAQRAFMNGTLRVGGNIAALINAHDAFSRLPDVFAAVRDDTEF
jgi:hypothetical protein